MHVRDLYADIRSHICIHFCLESPVIKQTHGAREFSDGDISFGSQTYNQTTYAYDPRSDRRFKGCLVSSSSLSS